MMVMCGLRGYDCGADTHSYWNYSLGGYAGESFGFIYPILRNIAALVSPLPTAFLMLMAFLTYIPILIIILRESSSPALSVLMFTISGAWFFLESFNISRQMIAVAFILYSAVVLSKNNLTISFLFFFIAFIFHPYSIIYLPFFLLYNKKLSYYNIIVLLCGSMIIGLVGSLGIVEFFIQVLASLTGGSSNETIAHLSKYGEYEIMSSFSLVGKLSHMLPPTIMCLILYSKFSSSNLYYKMYAYGCAILNICISVSFCERIAAMYTIAIVLALPMGMKYISRSRRNYLLLLIIFMLILYLYNINSMNYQSLYLHAKYPVPYLMFLNF